MKEITTIYYDRATGKVLNDLVEESLRTHDQKLLYGVKIGIMSANHAVLENGFVRNMPNKGAVYEWDANTRTMRELPPDPRFIEQKPVSSPTPVTPSAQTQAEGKQQFSFFDDPDLAVNLLYEEQRKAAESQFNQDTDAVLNMLFPRNEPTTPPPSSGRQRRRRATRMAQTQTYQLARSKSRTPQKQSQERSKKVYKYLSLALFISFLLGLLAALGIVNSEAIETMIAKGNLKDYSLVVSYVDEQVLRERGFTIPMDVDKMDLTPLERATFPLGQSKDQFFYRHDLLAQNILNLPPEAFDSYIYMTYEEMGVNRQNQAVNNLDELIKYLNWYADPEMHAMAYARIHGCDSFEQYLQKNGWVDVHGNPSVEAFIEFGRTEVQNKMPFLKAWLAKRGIILKGAEPIQDIPEDEAPTMGGR
ncbi:MAG: hypothetical protein E7167_00465 [Firmicutes bacterium]|nr:hypothetical protein [Bacillota bacterium]